MITKRKTLSYFIVFALSLLFIAALVACSGEPSPEQETSEQADTQDSVAKIELRCIVDEKLESVFVELQELYMKENKDISFAKNEHELTEELAQSIAADNLILDSPIPDDADKKSTDSNSYADAIVVSSREAMDEVEELGVIDLGTRFDLVTSALVIVAPKDSPLEEVEWADIASGAYVIALADEGFLSGVAAHQALSSLESPHDATTAENPESDQQSEESSSPTLTTVSVASLEEFPALLQSGGANVGLMYASDAVQNKELRVVGEVPSNVYTTLVYPAAIIAHAEHYEEMASFYAWITSNEAAQKIWLKHGFHFPG